MSDAQKPEKPKTRKVWIGGPAVIDENDPRFHPALSQPTEEIRQEGESLSGTLNDAPINPECLCAGWQEPNPDCPTCGHLVRPETPDVLPPFPCKVAVTEVRGGGGRRHVRFDFHPQPVQRALLAYPLDPSPHDVAVFVDGQFVPTEGYRVIREEEGWEVEVRHRRYFECACGYMGWEYRNEGMENTLVCTKCGFGRRLDRSNTCASCGEPGIKESLEEEHFQYGPDGDRLTAIVPVLSCSACGLEYTDERGARLRTEAVDQHRATNTEGQP